MEITEVRVKLVARGNERLRAFCSITLDGDFVVRDLKVIDGSSGPFVAMPSRKLSDRCPKCGAKNHLRARFCNDCGSRLDESRAPRDGQGRAKLHADVAHPINAECRESIQEKVIEAYNQELEQAKSPDYRPSDYDDYDDYDDDAEDVTPSGGDSGQAGKSDSSTPVSEPPKKAGRSQGGSDKPSRGQPADEDFSDYNALIADLKKEATTRRSKHESTRYQQDWPAQDEPPRKAGHVETLASDSTSDAEDVSSTDDTPFGEFPPADKPAKEDKKAERSVPPPSQPHKSQNEQENENKDDDDDAFGAGLL